jgi:GT2 family glycosyltransferase
LDYNSYLDYPENSLFEIACCGMAATLIHRRVFEDLQRKDDLGNTYWFSSKEFASESEDYNFCFRAREKGHKVWCDSSITTRHIGGVGIGRENRDYFKKNPEARLF